MAEFDAIDPSFIKPVRQRSGYDLPVGQNPSTKLTFGSGRAQSRPKGYYPGLSGASGAGSRIAPQSSLLYKKGGKTGTY